MTTDMTNQDDAALEAAYEAIDEHFIYWRSTGGCPDLHFVAERAITAYLTKAAPLVERLEQMTAERDALIKDLEDAGYIMREKESHLVAITMDLGELRERTNRIIKRLGDALLECRKRIIDGHSDHPAGDIAEIDKALYEAGSRDDEFLLPQWTYPDNDEPLTPEDQAKVDAAWEQHKAAKPVDVQADLLAALNSLSNEVMGLAAFDRAVRQAIGNTNYACLIQRADEARAAISRAEGK